MGAESLLLEPVHQIEGAACVQGFHEISGIEAENFHFSHVIHQVFSDSQIYDTCSISHSQQIPISAASSHYLQMRYHFPPFIIRLTFKKIISNLIKEELPT